MSGLTRKQWTVVDRALGDAAGTARTERDEDRILSARAALMRSRKRPDHAATVTATMEAVRDALRIWGTDAWVLDEVETALVDGRQPDIAAARERRRRVPR